MYWCLIKGIDTSTRVISVKASEKEIRAQVVASVAEDFFNALQRPISLSQDENLVVEKKQVKGAFFDISCKKSSFEKHVSYFCDAKFQAENQ